MDTIVVPYTATVHSAYGAVSSDRYRSFQLSDPQRTPPQTQRASDHFDVARITQRFRELEERCRAAMDHPELRTNRILYFRYRRQTHELPITVPNGDLAPADVDRLADEFHDRYERIYGKGTSLPEAGIEINTFRLEGRIPSPAPKGEGLRVAKQRGSLADALLGERHVIFGGERVGTAVYRGENVPAGAELDGPAILEFPGTTVVIGPNQDGHADAEGNIIVRLKVEVNPAAGAAGGVLASSAP
jgi:N-methylhydantoinase A